MIFMVGYIELETWEGGMNQVIWSLWVEVICR